jgi:hypothetical protein
MDEIEASAGTILIRQSTEEANVGVPLVRRLGEA